MIRKYQVQFYTYDNHMKAASADRIETVHAYTAEDAITQLMTEFKLDNVRITGVRPYKEELAKQAGAPGDYENPQPNQW